MKSCVKLEALETVFFRVAVSWRLTCHLDLNVPGVWVRVSFPKVLFEKEKIFYCFHVGEIVLGFYSEKRENCHFQYSAFCCPHLRQMTVAHLGIAS